MDEHARKIFEEAYDNIDRIDNMKMREPAMDDVVVKEWTPPKRRERGLDTVSPEQRFFIDASWNEWLDIRVAAALNNFSEIYSREVVDLMFTRMDKVKADAEVEIQKLREEVGQMRAELTLLRELAKGHVRELGRRTEVASVPHLSS
jgi:hypothetical protein